MTSKFKFSLIKGYVDPLSRRARAAFRAFDVPGSWVTVRAWAAIDSERLGLWTPVAIGAGSVLYFSAKSEPPFFVAAGVFFLLLILATLGRAYQNLFVGLIFICLGFLAADLRTATIAAPILKQEMKPATVSGNLLSVEEGARWRRLLIEVAEIEGLGETDTPRRVRITWRGKEFTAKPGDKISLRAGLAPPPEPVAPGAFDFAQHLFFQQIGAVGYAVTPPLVEERGRGSLVQRWAEQVEQVRLSLARRIVDAAPGEGGAVVAAIVTGKRGAISAATEAALRDSGLAHLLAISGLHMGLATGLVFFGVRFLLALHEQIALNFSIKKWSATAALLSGLFYLIISGAGWSARRAFIMTSIMFVAILVDRRALSLRNVAIAATIILLMTPEAVLHSGFQMSFAAVAALIAAYEWASNRQSGRVDLGALSRMRRYTIGIAVTDTIAALATAPYSLYHFNRAAVYGLPANIVAMPLMAFLIVPAAIVALLLMPFGLDGWAWNLSAFGLETVLAVASEVAGQPGAVKTTAQWSPLSLALVTLGGLLVCLNLSPLRYMGVAVMMAGLCAASLASPPHILLNEKGDNIAVVFRSSDSGEMFAVQDRRKSRFTIDAWRAYSGHGVDSGRTPLISTVSQCDELGCVLDINTAQVSFSTRQEGLADDCQRGDLVIATYPVSSTQWRACDGILIDKRSVWRRGAHAIWIYDGDKISVRTVRESRGERPWVRQRF